MATAPTITVIVGALVRASNGPESNRCVQNSGWFCVLHNRWIDAASSISPPEPATQSSRKKNLPLVLQQRESRKFRPIADAKLAKDVVKVDLDGAVGNKQSAPDLLVR
jgi:hypothetical protein